MLEQLTDPALARTSRGRQAVHGEDLVERAADREPRVERGVRVLEHQLDAAADRRRAPCPQRRDVARRRARSGPRSDPRGARAAGRGSTCRSPTRRRCRASRRAERQRHAGDGGQRLARATHRVHAWIRSVAVEQAARPVASLMRRPCRPHRAGGTQHAASASRSVGERRHLRCGSVRRRRGTGARTGTPRARSAGIRRRTPGSGAAGAVPAPCTGGIAASRPAVYGCSGAANTRCGRPFLDDVAGVHHEQCAGRLGRRRRGRG